MCEICKTSVARNYTHAKNKHHIKNLYEIMKIKQINNYYNGTYNDIYLIIKKKSLCV